MYEKRKIKLPDASERVSVYKRSLMIGILKFVNKYLKQLSRHSCGLRWHYQLGLCARMKYNAIRHIYNKWLLFIDDKSKKDNIKTPEFGAWLGF